MHSNMLGIKINYDLCFENTTALCHILLPPSWPCPHKFYIFRAHSSTELRLQLGMSSCTDLLMRIKLQVSPQGLVSKFS